MASLPFSAAAARSSATTDQNRRGRGSSSAPDVTDTFRFHGDANGHRRSAGAAQAHQARAGKLTKLADLLQPADAAPRSASATSCLANDKVAVYIRSRRRWSASDGYGLPAVRVCVNRPSAKAVARGPSALRRDGAHVRTGRSRPSVTVLADFGSDGGPAIVRLRRTEDDRLARRVRDVLPISTASRPRSTILEPAHRIVTMRYSLANTRNAAVSFANRYTPRRLPGVARADVQRVHRLRGPNGPRFVAWEGG